MTASGAGNNYALIGLMGSLTTAFVIAGMEVQDAVAAATAITIALSELLAGGEK